MKKVFLFCLLSLFTEFILGQNDVKEVFDYNGISMPYRLIKPTDISKKQPLVILLHGAATRGDDNESQLEEFGDFHEKFIGDYSSYVIVPQCGTDDYWSNSIKEVSPNKYEFNFDKDEPTQTMSALIELINLWVRSGKIDTDRIYVGGLSMGAFATYELLWRMPSKTFAAAFAICGATDTTPAKLMNYATNTPLWIFHGNVDAVVSVNYSRDVYTKLQQIENCKVKYTEYYGVDHNSWSRAFSDVNLIPWMFGYRNLEVGYYKISSSLGNVALTRENTSLLTSTFTAKDEQSWFITAATGSSYYLINMKDPGMYLSANGTSLNFTTTNSSVNQRWKLVPTNDGKYYIVSEANGTRLQLVDGGALKLSTDSSGTNEGCKWNFSHSRLFLTGEATYGGYDLNRLTEMKLVEGAEGIFSWTGVLKRGRFKFTTSPFSWMITSYTATLADIRPEFGKEYKLVGDDSYTKYDYNFFLDQLGLSTITVDTKKNTMKIEKSEITDLYMVGDATPVGWNIDSPVKMQKLEGNIYRWEGYMHKGSFKMVGMSSVWNPSINPKYQQTLSPDGSHDLNLTNGSTGDYMFVIPKPSHYLIEVDLNNMKLKSVKQTKGYPMFLIGDAAPTGWDFNIAQPLNEESEFIRTWTGYLKPGHFKFITQLGTWHSVVPIYKAHENIINGYVHNVSTDYLGDFRFNITEAGEYKITVDQTNEVMTINRVSGNRPIYIIGDAVPCLWDNKKALEMQEIGDGVYRWSGNMTEKKHFKFITQLGTWHSIVPAQKAHETITIGKDHRISSYYQGDYRYIMPESGTYTVTVDLKNKTVQVYKEESTLRASGDWVTDIINTDYTIIPRIGSVEVKLGGSTKVQRARLISLNGHIIDIVDNKNTSFNMGYNLIPGIYIVEMNIEGKIYTEKILLK